MTDKELLELSAKAVGYNIWWKTGACKGGEYESAFIGEVPWNPLADDGDALRLAVKLGIVIDTSDGAVSVQYIVGDAAYPITIYEFDDIYAATRRCITRAAAEIGKEMP
jgi:hypothetical protein